ncbi:hypothetical protein PM082_006246 [Marasmius tenuissimus]|nr:hypothetical protein PM082_006246 [Marasmius tenuissimus]
MEPEDEDDCFFGFYKPYLRLYEEQESLLYEQIWESAEVIAIPKRRDIKVTLDADESHSIWDDMDAYRYHHVVRFFHSLNGFYTGELDLTGRHLPRFTDLTSRFKRMVEDTNDIRKTVRRDMTEIQDADGKPITLVKCTIDEELWKQFRMKWKIPRAVNFGLLEALIEQTARIMQAAQGQPRFQKLHFLDLPPELIYHIFNLASIRQARLLASTCKALQNIGTSPSLYRKRTLMLRFLDFDERVQLAEEEPAPEVLDRITKETSKELISLTHFLALRPQITHLIRTLEVIDRWATGWEIRPFRCYVSENALYDRIYASIGTFLPCCRGLTDLSIHWFTITADWLVAISHLPNLRTIRLKHTCIEEWSVEDQILNSAIPRSPQVLDLSWYNETSRFKRHHVPRELASGHGLWYILLLFPNLRTFNQEVETPEKPDASITVGFPSLDIQDNSDMFCQGLRRLCLGLIPGNVPELTVWINSSCLRTSASCTLTHLKLCTYLPFPEDVAIPLLNSLASAPLEVLVLDGIKQCSLSLVERITQLFPDLLGLTLIQRDSRFPRWGRTRWSVWPHSSGEYAALFHRFRKLKYFGWNFCAPEYGYSPACLLVFEIAVQGVAGRVPVDGVNVPRGIVDNDDEFPGEKAIIARPFACHCLTLEVMVSGRRSFEMYGISRGSKGEVVSTRMDRFNVARLGSLLDWNPGRDGWRDWQPVDETSLSV